MLRIIVLRREPCLSRSRARLTAATWTLEAWRVYRASVRMLGSKWSQSRLHSPCLLEWRNWQTHGTQNPAPFTGMWVRPPPPAPTSRHAGQFPHGSLPTTAHERPLARTLPLLRFYPAPPIGFGEAKSRKKTRTQGNRARVLAYLSGGMVSGRRSAGSFRQDRPQYPSSLRRLGRVSGCRRRFRRRS